MRKVERWLEKVYERKITQENDLVVLVIGDAGVGKSTFMLQAKVLWKQITGQEIEVSEVLDELVWGEREEFRNALVDAPPRSCIATMDAAHALYRREAMNPEEKEAEKDLLDIRFNENLILLGYQDWNDVPKILASRRAGAGIYIPQRGLVRGFNRDSLDEKWRQSSTDNSWPQADLTDTFPSLEGTDIWTEFKRRDRERKRQRMGTDNDGEEPDEAADKTDVFAIAEQIKNDGLQKIVSIHGATKNKMIDKELIQVHYETSVREAKKVRKLLQTDPEVDPSEVDVPG